MWQNLSCLKYSWVSHNNAPVKLKGKLVHVAGIQTTLNKNHLMWSSGKWRQGNEVIDQEPQEQTDPVLGGETATKEVNRKVKHFTTRLVKTELHKRFLGTLAILQPYHLCRGRFAALMITGKINTPLKRQEKRNKKVTGWLRGRNRQQEIAD